MPIYLDHASTAWPKAPGVGAAMAAALDLAGSPGRGSSVAARAAEQIGDDLRIRLASLLNAGEPERIILTAGATESLNLAVAGIVHAAVMRGVDRPRIVTTQIEHNALRRPLLRLAAEGRIDLEIIPADSGTLVSPERVLAASRGAAMVALSWASNVTGAIQPVEAIARELAPTDTLLLVDASQSAGLIVPEIRLEAAGIDLLACSGHKALAGPPGVGALYIGPKAHPRRLEREPGGKPVDSGASHADHREVGARLAPTFAGGTGGESDAWHMPLDLPRRFEPGTPNVPAHAGLLAAIRGLASPNEALAHVRALSEHLRRGLDQTPGVNVLGPRDPRLGLGVTAFTIEGYEPSEAAALLELEFGIRTRSGLHCAPGAHEAMGTLASGGAIRASFGTTTTLAEVDALIGAVRAMLAV